jgi:hypothetical protein
MTAEQFVLAWIKSEILTPRKLAYFPQNLYHDAIASPVKDKRGKGAGADSKVDAGKEAGVHV